MKSFTERSPMVIGAVVIVVIAGATVGSLALNSNVFADRYTVTARFPDAAGVAPGDAVRVAGIKVGDVAGVEVGGDQVAVRLELDDGVELPADTEAAIVVETLLGQKYVRLDTGDAWQSLLEDGAVIDDGRTPTEGIDLINIGTPLLERLDGAAMNDVLAHLSAVTEGKQAQVAAIIDGLDRLTGEIHRRRDETAGLLRSASRLSATLAARDDELVQAVDGLGTVVDTLARRRSELVTLLAETRAAAGATADLVATNRGRLDAVLDELHADLEIIGRHQVDLAHSVAYLSAGIEGFSSIGYSAGGFPNQWANIFTQLLTNPDVDQVLGSCGPVDRALDIALGPDPLPCDRRDGPDTLTAGGASRPSGAARAGDAGPDVTTSLTMLVAPLLGEAP